MTKLINGKASGQAGQGGEGVVNDITGELVIYGSGGGGSSSAVPSHAGVGGTNGGAGGEWQAADGGYRTFEEACGQPGVDGTGSGGGGGCYFKNGTESAQRVFPGRGGDGTVILRFRLLHAAGEEPDGGRY